MQLHPNTHKLFIASSIGNSYTVSLVTETVTVYAYKTKTGVIRLNFCGEDAEDPIDQKAIGTAQLLYQKDVGVLLPFFEVKGRMILADRDAALKFISKNDLLNKVLMGENLNATFLSEYRSLGNNYGIPDNILAGSPVVKE